MPMTADQWNENYPIGTPVFAWPGARDEAPLATRTRTPAWTLGGGHPVVSVDGYAGGIWLEHIEPRDAESKPETDGERALRIVEQLSPETRERIAQRLHDSFHAITGTPHAMSVDYTAYAAYGFELPAGIQPDDIEERLNSAFRPVGYLTSGQYAGKRRVFLVADHAEAGAGDATPIPTDVHHSWDMLLRLAAKRCGVPVHEIPKPHWFLVLNVS